MPDIRVIVRTADQTRKAEVVMSREQTAGDIIQAAVDNWALPTDTDYTLTNSSNGKSILPAERLADGVVSDGDVLEVQPVLVAAA